MIWSTHQHHEISLICDDIEETVAELTRTGAEFAGEIDDEGLRLTTVLKIPELAR